MSHISLQRRIFYILLIAGILFLVNGYLGAIWMHLLFANEEIALPKNIVTIFSNYQIFYIDLEKNIGLLRIINNTQNPLNQTGKNNHLSGKVSDSEIESTILEYVPKEIFSNSSAENVKPWFVKGGIIRPARTLINKKTGWRMARIWPYEDNQDDRITNQLMFVPPTEQGKPEKLKKILIYYGLRFWDLKPGRDIFISSKCPVDTCTITDSQSEAPYVDAILYKDRVKRSRPDKYFWQVWILYFLEPPYYTEYIKYIDVINWTATYRRDSDIVTPYERWFYYNPKVKRKSILDRNYAANKTKAVAWFVSNCLAKNNRLEYARELKKYIPVDIYGKCGYKKCPKTKKKCMEILLKKYKFYLAFENSNCRDYITEKFFVNGLGRNILPIVMGAHPEDYAKSAPKHSYISVDDYSSAKELAAYLHKLDKDDDLYNSYFRWKGTGEFIHTRFFCRLCAMLHDDYPSKYYRDINKWWEGPGVCTNNFWLNTTSV